MARKVSEQVGRTAGDQVDAQLDGRDEGHPGSPGGLVSLGKPVHGVMVAYREGPQTESDGGLHQARRGEDSVGGGAVYVQIDCRVSIHAVNIAS